MRKCFGWADEIQTNRRSFLVGFIQERILESKEIFRYLRLGFDELGGR